LAEVFYNTTKKCWTVFLGPWAKLTHWPTDEMLGRGKPRSIAVGALVAIPSGAGVALSILAGNAGSLVGVAISASLLPPAVNCVISPLSYHCPPVLDSKPSVCSLLNLVKSEFFFPRACFSGAPLQLPLGNSWPD